MSTRAWAMKAEARLTRLEEIIKDRGPGESLADAVAALSVLVGEMRSQLAVLEARSHVHPGRKAQE